MFLVGQRDHRIPDFQAGNQFGRVANESKLRLPLLVVVNLDRMEPEVLADSGSECLGGRFFRGKSRGEIIIRLPTAIELNEFIIR